VPLAGLRSIAVALLCLLGAIAEAGEHYKAIIGDR